MLFQELLSWRISPFPRILVSEIPFRIRKTFSDNVLGAVFGLRQKFLVRNSGVRVWDHLCILIVWSSETQVGEAQSKKAHLPLGSRGLDATVVFWRFIKNCPVTPTPSTFSKILPYKWKANCCTNGRRTAVQMGGVLSGFPFFKA